MKYLLGLFLLFLGIQTSASTICGNTPINTYYFNNEAGLDTIKNCEVLNGSLIIQGDYGLTSLEKLSNLRHISGYMVILDSHVLNTLNGLQNLEHIHGDNLYLQQFKFHSKNTIFFSSIFIKSPFAIGEFIIDVKTIF